jgi:hypothetical protein
MPGGGPRDRHISRERADDGEHRLERRPPRLATMRWRVSSVVAGRTASRDGVYGIAPRIGPSQFISPAATSGNSSAK